MQELRIRDAVPFDADGIARVHVRSWQAAYRGLISDDILDDLSVSERAENWRRFIAEPLPTTLGHLVAERDDRIIGWCTFGTGRDEEMAADGEIYGIYADPEEWSSGVGHALLTEAVRRIADVGLHTVYLWVLDGNDRADRFYERHGFRTDGGVKLDERPGFTLSEHRRVRRLGMPAPSGSRRGEGSTDPAPGSATSDGRAPGVSASGSPSGHRAEGASA